MSYLVLARKWRPQTFDELVGQEPIGRILKNAITQNKTAHAYIFSGPRGVGKTSTARILAKAINCERGPTPDPCGKCHTCIAIADGSSMDVAEIDGASNRGIDNIRDLRESVRYAPSGSRSKVYIIDEAHMLTNEAFNALLKTLEEPPPNVIFVLATTAPAKIPSTVLSRCQHLPFRRVPRLKIKERLKLISATEGLTVTESALDLIARASDGSIRDSLTILDQIAAFSDNVTEQDIKDLLGITDLEVIVRLVSAVIDGDRKSIVMSIADLVEAGADLKAFAKDFLQFVRDLLIAKIRDDEETALDVGDEEFSAIKRLKDKATEEHLALLLSELIKAEPGIKSAFHPRIALEMALIRLSMLSHLRSINEALKIVQGIDMQQGQISKRRKKAETDKSASGTEPLAEEETVAPAVANAPRDILDPSSSHLSLSDAWNSAVENLEKTNHPLACKLREGTVAFNGDKIMVVYNGGLAVHAESVKENLPFIKGLVSELSGTKISVTVETAKGRSVTRKDLKEQALNNPIVAEALRLFEGRITDIIPNTNKSGE
ncbi:MAG: DNA polymerase III subunit gamma/tau [Dissulfurispiraceae bacterium]